MPILDTSKDLNALFATQAKRTPDLVALQDPAASLSYTYAQLDFKVEQLATCFRAQHGVTRDTLVGILMERSANYVIACLAALRAGGAFLVLELAYPPNLLLDVIQDANPAVIVTHAAHAPLIKANVPTLVLDKSGKEELPAVTSSTDKLPPLPPQDDLERLAFVSYSSGTTGKPKGIANPHRAPVKSYDLRFGVNDLAPGDRVACNVYFIWEMLRPLLRGATTIAVPDQQSYDPVGLVKLLAEEEITETLMTPTLLAAVLARHANLGAKLPKLKSLWLNGEVVTTDLTRRAIKALPNTRLLNCYSASETHEVACGDLAKMLPLLDPAAAYCPVGPPMDLRHTYVLDEQGNPVKPGETGELFVGGELLARGYLNLPETTAKAFTPDPLGQGANPRRYKTGDIARILPGSGLLEITGRVGGMIKIRGYSIVPGTVEKAIIDTFHVSNCAVVAHGDGLERQLVAYVVPDTGSEQGKRAELIIGENGYSPAARQVLVQHLAHYMIPTLWVLVDSLPTHQVSGKVDLKKLPSPAEAIAAASGTHSRARSPAPDEMINIKSIAQLWSVSLNMTPAAILEAGKDVNFFDLGGHSLLLADLATRISKTLGGFTVPLADLAGSPTLQGHVQATINARDGYNAAVQADLPSVLRKDIVLADDFKLAKSDVKATRIRDAKTILLTGATGFLGGFLLHDLLQHSSARIICLIRFNAPYRTDRSAAMARLRRNMIDLGLWSNSMLDRIDVVPANLSRNRLGLVPEVYQELVDNLDVIVHCAAQVNLVYPYGALRDANVEGTREVLRLAFLSSATVQYISTNGVLPPTQTGWPETEMTALDEVPQKLHDGYCQTKWVAEQIVLEAVRRGLPANVIRIGTISGHSQTGSTNTYDLISAIIVESLVLGVAPEIPDWHVEMTAVDFVSRGVVAIGNHIDPKQPIYHLGDADPIDCRQLFEHLQTLGYPTTRTDWTSWTALWQQKRGSAKGGDHGLTVDILRSGMPPQETLLGIIALKDDLTKAALEGLQRPKVDAALLHTYARHWYSRGWLHQQPKSISTSELAGAPTKAGTLAGKVAHITGDSETSALIAKLLSREGATVKLGGASEDSSLAEIFVRAN